MKRRPIWAWMLALSGSQFLSDASAQEPRADEPSSPPRTRAERRAAQAYQDGCPVVCAQHQACVQHRCVDMCRPDCREGTHCTPAGTCEASSQPSHAILTEAERQRLSGLPSSDSKWLVFADLGGLIGFGVRPGLEYGDLDSVLFRLHFLNTGVMSHAVFVENENEYFDWGFGASVGYRHYESSWGNLRGFYVGGGLDYSVNLIRSRGETDLSQLRHAVAPYGEFGYRWVFDHFALAFGPTLALRYPVFVGTFGGDKELCKTEIECEETSRRFEGTVNFEVGWFQ